MSHGTIPHSAMYKATARADNLVIMVRLPSALDIARCAIIREACGRRFPYPRDPAGYEHESARAFLEQLVRPTGGRPVIEVRPAAAQSMICCPLSTFAALATSCSGKT